MKSCVWGPSALAFTLLFSLAACKGTPAQTETTTGGEFDTELQEPDGIQRMRSYDFEDTVRVDGRLYSYAIHRESSDSLPVVVDEEGMQYADNYYRLSIERGGQQFFSRRFTKATFASYLSSDFLEKGLLDGMICDRSLPGLCFAVSVTLPQSDMVEPLLLHVDPAGGIAIERDTRSENDFEEQE